MKIGQLFLSNFEIFKIESQKVFIYIIFIKLKKKKEKTNLIKHKSFYGFKTKKTQQDGME